jgi:hypothetical protein
MPRFRRGFFALALVAAAHGLRAPWRGHDLRNLDEGSTFPMAQQVLASDIPCRDAADSITPCSTATLTPPTIPTTVANKVRV